jgi:uncharacterized membrane protein
MDKVMMLLISFLFVIMGNYMGKLRPNWFIGIRTPWTISDEENWVKTHRLGAKTWVIGGILSIIFTFVSPVLTFITIITAGLLPALYSFILFVQKKKA